MKNNPHNLINYFKAFYILGLHTIFKADQQAIYWALLHKFNSALYPNKIKISNSELVSLTNIPLRSLYRHRDEWNTYRHLDTEESWIIKYESGSTRDYGIYEMNFEFFNKFVPKNEQNNINDKSENGLVPKLHKSDTNQNGLVPKLHKSGTPSYTRSEDTIQDSSSSSSTIDPNNNSPKIENEKEDDEDLLSQQEKKAQDILYPIFNKLWDMRPFLTEDLQVIGGYPEEQIKEVGLTAKREHVYVKKLAVYIMNGLKHHAVLYEDKIGNNGHKPKESEWEVKVAKKRTELKNKLSNCSSREEFFVRLRDRAFLDEDRIPDLWDGYKTERLKWDENYTLDDFMKMFNESRNNMTIYDVVNGEN